MVASISSIFKRTTSDENFILSNKLKLGTADDSQKYLIHLLEKYIGNNKVELPAEVTFKEETCLENRLDQRTTTYVPDADDDVKIMVAVSGAGKTRTLLELLHQTKGYYFTARSSVADFGSTDLRECQTFCVNNYGIAKRAIQLLYYIRVSVCNYLIDKGFDDPKTILFAQLHPKAYFGSDVFSQIFDSLKDEPDFNSREISNPFPFVAIDEIQNTVEMGSLFQLTEKGRKRPFFTPLVYRSKLMQNFPTFIIAGTGINFGYITELAESICAKANVFLTYKVVSKFLPMSASQVESYASSFLTHQKIAKTEVEDVARRLFLFHLCHGRPRFVAFILEKYMVSKDIELVISEFVAGLSDTASNIFPIRFISDSNGNNPLHKVVGGETVESIIHQGLLSLILTGKLRIILKNGDGAAAIRYGIAYGECFENRLRSVVINEAAVIESLRLLIPFSDMVLSFTKNMSQAVNPQTVGYLLEYLVAFALVANYADDENILSKISAWQHSPYLYLLQEGSDSHVLFPDHMCGPDIIYKCHKTKTVYIVQVKFVKKMSKQEMANAIDTTDSEKFYCKRKLKEGESGNVVIKGFTERRESLQESLLTLQRSQYSIQQLLFIHSAGTTSQYSPNATIINSKNNPSFFDKVGSNVWEFLDSLHEQFQ